MIGSATQLKIVAVFEIIIASLFGASIPFLYIRHLQEKDDANENREALNTRPVFFILKAMTCGVILGVSLLHLAPDAEENLGEEYGYPVTFVLMGAGIVLNLVCEQVALYIISTTNSEDPCDSKKLEPCEILLKQQQLLDSGSCDGSHHFSALTPRPRMDSCEVDAVVAVFANASDPRALLKAYVLEGAIAVHSIIMGVSLGSMQEDELDNIKILMIAYAFHQFLEGISLGCAMSSTNLSPNKISSLVMFFACTLPVGIVLGLIITFCIDDSHTQGLVEGYANAVAAGILIYVSMVEMLAEEFSHPAVKGDFVLKSKMISAMIFGLGAMSALAVWA